MELPVVEEHKFARVACSACSAVAPFTLAQWEEDGPDADPEQVQARLGWQLRLIATDVLNHGEPARAWRWDLFCPACAGEMSPRSKGSIRLRHSGDAIEIWPAEEER